MSIRTQFRRDSFQCWDVWCCISLERGTNEPLWRAPKGPLAPVGIFWYWSFFLFSRTESLSGVAFLRGSVYLPRDFLLIVLFTWLLAVPFAASTSGSGLSHFTLSGLQPPSICHLIFFNHLLPTSLYMTKCRNENIFWKFIPPDHFHQ